MLISPGTGEIGDGRIADGREAYDLPVELHEVGSGSIALPVAYAVTIFMWLLRRCWLKMQHHNLLWTQT